MTDPTPAAPDAEITDRAGWLRKANDVLAQGDRAGALELLDHGLGQYPDDRLLRLRKAFVLRQLGRFAEALACLDPLGAEEGRDVPVVMEMAANCRALGDHARAAGLFGAVVQLDAGNKGAWLGLIDSALALSDNAAALCHAEAADAALPGEFAFGLKRAVALRGLGRSRDAVEVLQALLLRFPEPVQVRLALAAACREAGQFSLSRAQYEAVLEREAGNKAAWLGAIDTALAAKQGQAAQALVERAAAHLAGDADFGIKTGLVLQKNGHYRAAIDHLDALAKAHPGSVPLQLALTSACLIAEDEALYRANAARLQQLAPAVPALHERLAGLANARGNWIVAAEQSLALREMVPDHVGAAIILARGRLAMGETAAAEALLAELLERQPEPRETARALLTLAQLQHVKGDGEAAIATLKRARAADPANVGIVIELITRTSAASREEKIGGLLDDLIGMTETAPNQRLIVMLAEYGRLAEAQSLCRDWQRQFAELDWIPYMLSCLARLKGEAAGDGEAVSVAPPARRPEQFRAFLDATWQPPADPAAFVGEEPPSSDPSVYAVAWSHCRVPGLGYSEWKRRADHATRIWMDYDEVLFDDISELEAFRDYMDDDSLAGLAPLAEQRRPCFIVSSHMGLPAHLWFLSRRIPQFQYLSGWAAGVSEERRAPFNPVMTSLNNVATVRAVKRLIEAGGVFGGMPDAPFVAFNPKFVSGYSFGTLAGQKFRISNLIPRLAWRWSVPTFWVQPVWKNRRIVVEIEEIKVASAARTEEDWLGDWTDLYLQRLERLISGAPENLNLRRASAWRYLSARNRSPDVIDTAG